MSVESRDTRFIAHPMCQQLESQKAVAAVVLSPTHFQAQRTKKLGTFDSQKSRSRVFFSPSLKNHCTTTFESLGFLPLVPFVLLFGLPFLLLRVVPVGATRLRRRRLLAGGLGAIFAPVLVSPLLSFAVLGVVATAFRRARRRGPGRAAARRHRRRRGGGRGRRRRPATSLLAFGRGGIGGRRARCRGGSTLRHDALSVFTQFLLELAVQMFLPGGQRAGPLLLLLDDLLHLFPGGPVAAQVVLDGRTTGAGRPAKARHRDWVHERIPRVAFSHGADVRK